MIQKSFIITEEIKRVMREVLIDYDVIYEFPKYGDYQESWELELINFTPDEVSVLICMMGKTLLIWSENKESLTMETLTNLHCLWCVWCVLNIKGSWKVTFFGLEDEETFQVSHYEINKI